MVRLTVKHLMVGAFLAGFLNGRTVPAQECGLTGRRASTFIQEVTPAPSEDFQTPTVISRTPALSGAGSVGIYEVFSRNFVG